MKRGTVLGLVCCLGIGALARGQGGSVGTPADRQSQLPQFPLAAGTQLAGNYGKLPLSFEANLGQAGKSVQFLSRGDGYGLYLTGDEAVLALHKGGCAGQPGFRRAEAACEASADMVRMRLAGASGNTMAPAGEERLPGTANYFIGADPALWRTNVPTYAKVRYRGVYPGVDLVYYGSQRQLEYDFLVAPGADPKPIRLRFTGAKSVRLGVDGNLIVTAAGGELNFHKPLVYQLVDGQRQPVEGSFALLTKRTAGFRLGSYDRSKPLVIDPALDYATYLGGSGSDQASAIAVDADGNAYVAGYTSSSDFPVTQGALDTTVPAGFRGYAAFVTKLNPSGTALVYSSYLVASGGAVANAVAVDGSGNAYVAGRAETGFPVTPGAFQTNISDGAFVAKLNPAGSALVYSTYLSGTSSSYEGIDSAAAVVVDGAGYAYVAGATFSGDFPVTTGAFQTKNKAGFAPNAFVSKLNPAGSALVYSTYLGGSGRMIFSMGPQRYAGDGATGLAVDGAGNAYVAGYANSNDFPVTAGAFQSVNRATVPYTGGVAPASVRSNAFVTKLNPAGTALIYSTYLGGSTGSDSAAGVAVDGSGNAYVAGAAASTDFPVTSGAFQPAKRAANATNGFVTKLNPAGSALFYSTYVGGSDLNSAVSNGETSGDGAAGIAVDGTGHAYITGMAGAPDFPVTQGAFQTVSRPGDGRNAYLTELNAAGTALIYSTYLGGSGGDWGNAVAIDGSGKAYIAGTALSTNFPVTQGAFQTVNHATGGNGTVFVAKFDLSAILSAPTITPGGIVPVDSNVGTIQPGEWASIYGTNLADSAETWANGPFPNYLGGSSVTVDGRPAYLTYVSPGQINLQVPDDPAVGTVSVVVTTGGGSATANVTLADFAPAFLLQLDGRHVAGVILRQDGSGTFGQGVDSYDLLGPTGNSLGYPTVAAKTGDILELFGTGFGPTIPAVPSGQAFSSAAPTVNAVSVLINGVSVTPMWAGLSGAGLDQINLTIPAGLGTGDVPLVATVGGVQTPTFAVISLQ